MSTPKMIPATERLRPIHAQNNSRVIDQFSLEDVINLDTPVVEDTPVAQWPMHPRPMLPSRVAIIGNYLPRQCGIATFTTDLCDAISTEYGSARLFAVPVNDTESGYAYPERVRLALSRTTCHLTNKPLTS